MWGIGIATTLVDRMNETYIYKKEKRIDTFCYFCLLSSMEHPGRIIGF
jgi:hypothetical protein